ncbi:RDD family protein [Shimia marina]|uniref:RDD family protein n=1 Tax=Shimia marina TaxID=321267 RepID=A0A0N7LS97_9RHOB|nr:RDD family protein [Shimia marina]CUH53012.1 RDD family protein [Shimia marina]SFD92348.1 RDD family protein [Shimia marina]
MTQATTDRRSYALPDPDTQSEFYQDVTFKRALAWVTDSALVFVLCVLVLPFTAFTGLLFFGGLVLVFGFAYRVVTLTTGSATWGMRLMSIEMRQSDGARFDLGAAFLHTLGYRVSVMFPILQIISIVLMLTSARKQGLTDHVMGTVAINRAARY